MVDLKRFLAPRPPALVALAIVIAISAYWTGLQGPFLLDDAMNLEAIPMWLDGNLGLGTLLFERGAGAFGRPISMASLAFNAWLGGFTPHALKLGNLIMHLLCGLVIYCLLARTLRRDGRLSEPARTIAAITTAVWLLHPLHASTVLYAVQRMAQVSTLFVLLGLWLYVHARERMEKGPSRTASGMLLLGVPTLTAVAFLGKENGALLPLLCLVIEISWFQGKRPSPVRLFHALFVALPLLIGIVLAATRPQLLTGGYAGRDFTMIERLLTQGRVLGDYIGKLVLPNPTRMGIYTDDFVISTGLLSPPTTLLAFVLLLAASVAAWRWRKNHPAIFFGWFFFLVAHALESTVIPLEVYFEHRNYLPSVGLLLVLVSLFFVAGEGLARGGLRTSRIGGVLLVGALSVLALQTHGRALVWRSGLLIAESSLAAHPRSLRASAAVVEESIRSGDRKRANQIVEGMVASPSKRHRSLGRIYRLLIGCQFDHRGRPDDLAAFANQAPLPLTMAETQSFNLIYEITGATPCAPFTDVDLAGALITLADRAQAQPGSGETWRLRYQAAAFLVRAEEWSSALPQATLAWHPGAEPPVSFPLFQSQLQLGDIAGAAQTLKEVSERADPSNSQDQEAIRWMRAQIEAARSIKLTHPDAPATH